MELNRALDSIADADDIELAGILICGLKRLGELGRAVSEEMVGKIKAENGPDALTLEGLAQIESVEGVLSGRTDSL